MRGVPDLDGLDLSSFSGVVAVSTSEGAIAMRAAGLADRRWSIPMQTDSILGIASGTKGVTAVTAMALVEADAFGLDTPARSLLGSDLPLVDDAVTIEHLLSHRSGIGDYLDESELDDVLDHVLPIPVHRLDRTSAYIPVLDGRPQSSPPGGPFAYNNSGFVLLALLIERATGRRFDQLAEELVLRPAGMADSGFFRMDALPHRAATGHLTEDPLDLRTNQLHLPVAGSGDGGMFSTAADLHRFWSALLDGTLLPLPRVEEMTARRSDSGQLGYGLGFWLTADGAVQLEGYDAGVSFLSRAYPDDGSMWTVLSNTSEGAWPIARMLQETDE